MCSCLSKNCNFLLRLYTFQIHDAADSFDIFNYLTFA